MVDQALNDPPVGVTTMSPWQGGGTTTAVAHSGQQAGKGCARQRRLAVSVRHILLEGAEAARQAAFRLYSRLLQRWAGNRWACAHIAHARWRGAIDVT